MSAMQDAAAEAALKEDIYQLNRLAERALERGARAEACRLLEIALERSPTSPKLCNNMALVLQDQGNLPEALLYVYRGLVLDDSLHELHYTHGLIAAKMGYRQGAIQAYEHCIELKPDCAPAHLNLALQYFYLQEWLKGWEHYEWRFEAHSNLGNFRKRFDRPHWQGEDLRDKTLLLYCEQGLGDAIMFARYVLPLYERGAKVWIEAPRELVRLFRYQPGVEHVIERNPDLTLKPELPEHDYVCSFCSLPHYLGFVDFPGGSFPYLRAEGRWGWGKVEGRKRRVAVVWAGAAHHPDDKIRSMPRHEYEPLKDLEIDLVGLHHGEVLPGLFDDATFAPNGKESLNRKLGCFYETALFLKDVDLLITVDTAVAHLAGALNRPVWLLLGQPHDWRWPLDGEQIHWYPSMRIFRQAKPGDWAGVIDQVKDALEEWLAEQGQPKQEVQWA